MNTDASEDKPSPSGSSHDERPNSDTGPRSASTILADTANSSAPQIPDHDLLRRIGEGAYGEVWLARSVTGTYRAVKIISRQKFENERPYEREFAGIKKFEPISRSHEGLVDVLHVGRNDPAGYFYYVMELADDAQIRSPESSVLNWQTYISKTLKTVLDKGRLPVEQCVEIGLSLASALDHLHKSGLLHRDIKPSNIIFVGGVPKLADIGLVATVTQARSFVGTEGFIPPEGPGTAQADIYAFGKVLYEMSTGKDRLDFPALPSDLPDAHAGGRCMELNKIILKACEDDPQQRYKSAEAMRSDLLRLQAGESIEASVSDQESWIGKLRDAIRKRPALSAAAVFVVLIAAGLVCLVTNPNGGERVQSSEHFSFPPRLNALAAADVLKIAYSGSPPAAAQDQSSPPQLQFEVLGRHQGETAFQPLRDGDMLRSGIDEYVILANPLSAGYFYLFQVDSSGKKEWLFPENKSSTNSSGSNPVHAGKRLHLPSEKPGRAFYLDNTPGVEHIYAVFSATQWTELESALISPDKRSARTVEVPNELRTRGVGGIRTNRTQVDQGSPVQGVGPTAVETLLLSRPSFEASENVMVIERWFKHLSQ